MSNEHQWAQEGDFQADPEERQVIHAVLDSFYQYRRVAHLNGTHRRRQAFYALPSRDWQLLAAPPFSMLKHFDDVDNAIDINAKLADAILETALLSFGLPDPATEPSIWKGAATPLDIDKARTTLNQFYRDWSAEGAVERDLCYKPILDDLQAEFGKLEDVGEIQVLIPGAGLGRLVYEVCKAGFAAEGNEISYHALVASDFILNHTFGANKFRIFPFALTFSNQPSKADQLASFTIPDVHPATELNEASKEAKIHAFERMRMAAADFSEIYAKPERAASLNAVATAFFVDTASNILDYIRTVQNCLLPNGIWTNTGPLLWHHEEGSKSQIKGGVELSFDDVILLLKQFGFAVETAEIIDRPAGYIQNPRSMLQNTYQIGHWVARKTS